MSRMAKVVLAAAAGFVAGVLTAPKSGKETREDLMKKGDDLKAEAEIKKEQVKQAARDGAESFKKSASKVEKEARDMAKSAAHSGRVMRDEAERLGEEAKVRGSRAAEAARKAANDVRVDANKNVK